MCEDAHLIEVDDAVETCNGNKGGGCAAGTSGRGRAGTEIVGRTSEKREISQLIRFRTSICVRVHADACHVSRVKGWFGVVRGFRYSGTNAFFKGLVEGGEVLK